MPAATSTLNEGSATEVAEGRLRYRRALDLGARPSTKVPRPKSRKVAINPARSGHVTPQRRFRDRSRGRVDDEGNHLRFTLPQRRFRDRSRGRQSRSSTRCVCGAHPQRRFRDRSRGRRSPSRPRLPLQRPQRRFRDRSRGRWSGELPHPDDAESPQRRFRDRSRGRPGATGRGYRELVPQRRFRDRSRGRQSVALRQVQHDRPSTKVPRPKSRKDRHRQHVLGQPETPLNEGSATEVAEGWFDDAGLLGLDVDPQRRFRDRSRGRAKTSRGTRSKQRPQRRFRDRSRGRPWGDAPCADELEALNEGSATEVAEGVGFVGGGWCLDCPLNEGSATEVAEGRDRGRSR